MRISSMPSRYSAGRGISRRHAADPHSDRGGQPVTPENQVLTMLPVLPIRNTVLFPNLFLPLTAGRPGSVAAIEAALSGEDKTLLVVAQRDGSVDATSENLYRIGTRAV